MTQTGRIKARVRLILCAGSLACMTGCPAVVGTIPGNVPDFNAAKFTRPLQIDNPLFPLVAGTTMNYAAQTSEGPETTIVEVLADTRVLSGVTCRVVRDRVSRNNVLIEDTHDFYAQDDDGNVWYMGEDVNNYDYGATGNLFGITHEGSWEAGKDVAGKGTNALPGHLMRAVQTPGNVYYQEFYRGEAEDTGEIVALNVAVRLGNNKQYMCLKTRDLTALEPSKSTFKYYAPGVGLVLTEAPDGSDRDELVSTAP